MTKATLALETGRVYGGRSFGALRESEGEVVFCTALTGYQEIVTDPSYHRQIVVMTYPHIGNYGVGDGLDESAMPRVAGFVAREFTESPVHWRAGRPLGDYFARHNVPGVEDIDTRSLVRHLRDRGVCRGVIALGDADPELLVRRAKAVPPMTGADLVSEVTCAERYEWMRPIHNETSAFQPRVALMDYGAKAGIMDCLMEAGCEVTVFPARTTFEDVVAAMPDGIMLSNGPGDPAAVTYAVDFVRRAAAHNERAARPIPVFGICLGHQILGLALGGKTRKLPFGHRGANHPVKDLSTGRVDITTQNHGFVVDTDSLKGCPVEPTHINLNDHTLEGLRHRSLPMFSVQYHPEARPGPHDARHLFQGFVKMMAENRS